MVPVWKANLIRQRTARSRLCAGVGLSCDLDSPAKLSYLDFARLARHVARSTTGYALILGVVAIFIYGTYLALGSSVSSLANGVDSTLTAASRGSGAAAQSTPKP